MGSFSTRRSIIKVTAGCYLNAVWLKLCGVFKCLKSAYQVPNNGILEEVTHGSRTIVAKQSLAVEIRFLKIWDLYCSGSLSLSSWSFSQALLQLLFSGSYRVGKLAHQLSRPIIRLLFVRREQFEDADVSGSEGAYGLCDVFGYIREGV
ncbi:hypothetical protein A2U01_0011263 [Trifolium medium]|uniref:Uncharacterized protein n=1 Tax=Trifolium medium TaxID=97028 RepID=A0A392MTP7_9FABA|nr:hypothetical protein [Trifolium medium]